MYVACRVISGSSGYLTHLCSVPWQKYQYMVGAGNPAATHWRTPLLRISKVRISGFAATNTNESHIFMGTQNLRCHVLITLATCVHYHPRSQVNWASHGKGHPGLNWCSVSLGKFQFLHWMHGLDFRTPNLHHALGLMKDPETAEPRV